MSTAANTSQRALPIKRQRFARHFASHGNASRAARESGYSEKAAHAIGHDLLKIAEVQQAIERERRQILTERGITPNGVLGMIADIAKFDIDEVFDGNGSIREISEMSPVARRVVAGIDTFTITAKDGTSFTTTAKIKLPDRLRALELLAKHFSLLHDNVKVSGDAANPFIAIIERAQGTALQPISQRDDDDTQNAIDDGEQIIEGEIIAKEDAPPQTMASDDALAAFNSIDDTEDDEGERDAVGAEETQAAQAPVADPAPEPLFRSRRKHSRLNW